MATTTINPIASKNILTQVECNLKVLKKGEKKKPNQRMICILNQEDGDKRIVWDSGSLTEINEAKKTFDDLVQQGLVPYRVDALGKKTDATMSEFDAEAEEIIFAPVAQLVGG